MIKKRANNSGNESLKEKYLDETLQQHKKENDNNPKDSGFSLDKAELLVKDDRYDEVVVCYDKILERGDGNERLWYQKGEALTRLERYEEAIECYNMAVQLEPKFEEAWYMLGELLKKQDAPDKAKECFSRILEINPDNTKIKKALITLSDDRTIDVKSNDIEGPKPSKFGKDREKAPPESHKENQTNQASEPDIPSTQELLPIFEELAAYIDELEHDKGNKDETKENEEKD